LSPKKVPQVGIIIPARLDSVRLPKKLLMEFYGLPMIEHVRRRALLNSHGLPVIVATGDEEISDLIKGFGGDSITTVQDHQNGLSRVGEAAEKLGWDQYIILQGDEILVLPRHLDQMIDSVLKNPLKAACNAVTKIHKGSEITDPSVVKCLRRADGDILFIFRETPLVSPTEIQSNIIHKICGLFSISSSSLLNLLKSPKQPIADTESIEQMKILELAMGLGAIELDVSFPSVNLAKDVEEVIAILTSHQEQIKLLNTTLQD
jgi:3-deoxy-manno-octulosonate cytidylyltransferase (CMP-KDO synthetase)